MEIKTVTPEQYAEFGRKFENFNFLNAPEMGAHFQNEGIWNVEYLGGFEKGELKAAAMVMTMPLAKIRKYAKIPRGFLADFTNPELLKGFVKALQNHLKSEGVVYLEMDPYIGLKELDVNGTPVEGGWNNSRLAENLQSAGFEYLPPMPGNHNAEPVYVSELDIKDKKMDQLLKEMDQQTRWSINRSRKMDLTLEPASTKEQLEEFRKMMISTGERNGFESPEAAYYESFLKHHPDNAELVLAYLEPDKMMTAQQKLYDEAAAEMEQVEAKLAEVPGSKKMIKRKKVLQEAMDVGESKKSEAAKLEKEHGNRILLAGSLFVWDEKEMVYLFSGAYNEFFKMHAPYAIHDRMMQKAINLGLDTYNFYGIAGVFEKDKEGYSLFDFKRGFGCVPKELLGTFRLPVRSLEYSLYRKLKKM